MENKVQVIIQYDGTAKSGNDGFRMDREKDEVRKFEAATLCGNSRKLTNFGLSGAAERQVVNFGSAVQYVKPSKK